MRIINFNYSMKNIPIHSKLQYQKMLVNKTESFIKRMRWKLFAIQNPNTMKQKQTYGFNTSNSPPPMKELKLFEEDMFEMIKKIEFRTVRNNFQTKLKQDINVIKKTPEIIISADKTQNKYTVSVDDYSKQIHCFCR